MPEWWADSERTCSGYRGICEGQSGCDTAKYQTINYANAATKGPAIIVLPGEVKSNNATFTQRYFPNNIADYAELELSQANFQVWIAPIWAACCAKSNSLII